MHCHATTSNIFALSFHRHKSSLQLSHLHCCDCCLTPPFDGTPRSGTFYLGDVYTRSCKGLSEDLHLWENTLPSLLRSLCPHTPSFIGADSMPLYCLPGTPGTEIPDHFRISFSHTAPSGLCGAQSDSPIMLVSSALCV